MFDGWLYDGVTKFSFVVILSLDFFNNVTYSVVMPSIYKYVTSFHETELFFGLALASFSIACFIVTPIMTYFSVRCGLRLPLALTAILPLMGGLCYASARSAHTPVLIVIGRVVAGCGQGAMPSVMTWISRATPESKRTTAISLGNSMSFLGLLAGPGLAILMAGLHVEIGHFVVDDTTCPGLISAASFLILTTLLVVSYSEPPSPSDEASKATRNKPLAVLIEVLGGNGAWLPLVIMFLGVLIEVCLEAAVTPLTKRYYRWDSLANSLLFTGFATCGAIAAGTTASLSSRVSDRTLILVGMGLMGVGLVSTVGIVAYYGEAGPPVAGFVSGTGIYFAGFLAMINCCSSVYTKLVKKHDQSMFMGLSQMLTTLACVLAPLISGAVLQFSSVVVFFSLMAGLWAVGMLLLAIWHRNLVLPATTLEDVDAEAAPASDIEPLIVKEANSIN